MLYGISNFDISKNKLWKGFFSVCVIFFDRDHDLIDIASADRAELLPTQHSLVDPIIEKDAHAIL